MRCIVTLGIVGMLAVAVPRVQAAPLVYEPFDNSTGELSGETATGEGLDGTWSGESGPSVVDGSLTYGTLPTSGNRLRTATNDAVEVDLSAAVINEVTPDDGETTEVWMSLLFTADRVSTRNSSVSLDRSDGTNDMNGIVTIADSGDDWGVKAGNATPTLKAEAVEEDEVYFYLAKFELSLSGGTEKVEASAWRFENGELPASEAALGTPVKSSDSSTFDRFPGKLRINSGFGDLEYDEIRVGTSFDAVVIPEPASLMLVWVGAGLIVTRRRVRS